MQLLFDLEGALPHLREDVERAKLLGTYPQKASSRNKVLNYAFDRASRAVIENALLRLSEAIAVFLHPAAEKHLKRPLIGGAGRQRRPIDPDFALVLSLRDEMVAHRLKMSHLGRPSYDELQSKYDNVYDLLLATLSKVEALIGELRDAGLYGDRTLASAHSVVPTFTAIDVTRLIAAANALPSESESVDNSPTKDRHGSRIALVKLRVADLGFPQGATTRALIGTEDDTDDYGNPAPFTRAAGAQLGLTLCPAEAGPEYRLEYNDQPLGERLYVAMKPITGSDGEPRIFVLEHKAGGLSLDAASATPDATWQPTDVFMFCTRPTSPLSADSGS